MTQCPLDVVALRRALTHLGPVEVLEQCGSTNRRLAQTLTTDLQVLATEHQQAGLGRLGRTWVTPARTALTFSVGLLPAGVPVHHLPWLPLLAGLAVVDGLDRFDVGATLKWPNDVLLDPPDGRPGKVAGILASAAPDHTILGIGINVLQDAADLPVPEATSLVLAGARRPDRTELLIDILTRLAELIQQWRRAGGDPELSGVGEQVRARLGTLGRRVRVELPGASEPLLGIARDLDAGGRLVVQTDNGPATALAAGDVHHVRAETR